MSVDSNSASVPTAEEILAPSPTQIMRRKLLGHAGITIGGGVLLVMIFMALFAPWIAPFDPFDQDLSRRLIPPI